MEKEKLHSLEDLGRVFSVSLEEISSDDKNLPHESISQKLEAHFSHKGRNGKVVTIIKGFVGSEKELKTLAKLIKSKCSVGGSVKGGEIIIQGNIRDKIINILTNQGHTVKRVGG